MEVAQKKPLVSIGLAVFNGEKYLAKAIESILNQTYQNIELIISDNASTDRTPEICKHYVAQDHRVRYSRQQSNIGGANNENYTFTISNGKYFRWAAHDDLLAPKLIEKCVEILEKNPSIVLCHSIVAIIDENGKTIRGVSRLSAQNNRPSQRFFLMTKLDHNCEEIYGLMRSEILQQTGLQRNYTDSDRTLLAQMCLYGKFQLVPETLFFNRVHPEKSTEVYPEWRERMLWFGDAYATKVTLPHWAQFLHYLKIIMRAPINTTEKFRCYLYMLVWVTQYRRWRSLGKDILLAGHQLVNSIIAKSSSKIKQLS